ncbi:Kinesin-like protein KLP1 [Platanthera guangdongensis]|uniref:Kinesin-like protein KLP1 n=1 Tax=Platanthera guangdongensis TaxID=2320717 RepID=A0ABR2M3P8_9ASPA
MSKYLPLSIPKYLPPRSPIFDIFDFFFLYVYYLINSYTLDKYFYKIFKEVFDLLDLHANAALRIDNYSLHAKPSRPPIQIRETTNGGIILLGVTEAEVKSQEEMVSYLMCGSQSRATGSTNMNNQSSRSHAIFTICLEQRKNDDCCDEILLAKFHLVDLAGSERAKRTRVGGLLLKKVFKIFPCYCFSLIFSITL